MQVHHLVWLRCQGRACDELSRPGDARNQNIPVSFAWPEPWHAPNLPQGTVRSLSTHLRKWNEDQESDEADRGGRTTALVGVRGRSQRTRRLRPADVVSTCSHASEQESAVSGDGAEHAVVAGESLPTFGDGQWPGRGAHDCGKERADHRSGRRQREQTPGATRLSNKRRGPSTWEAMALPRRKMHVGRPTLSGRPDEAVWHSSVQGEER